MIKIYVAALLLAIVGIRSGHAKPHDNGRSSTTSNATLLSSMREFPHQVSIYASHWDIYCSGSIITPNWILTNYVWCVGDLPSDITIMFNTLNVNVSSRTAGEAYALTLNRRTSVRKVENSNLALIQLPTTLQFSVNVSKAALAIRPVESYAGRRAVMTGLRVNGTHEAYGEFEILSDALCSAAFSWYNADRDVCAMGPAVPCWTTQGAGLLIDWPTAPRLIGTYFTAPWDCVNRRTIGEPVLFMRISAHLNSIEDVVKQRVDNNGYFF